MLDGGPSSYPVAAADLVAVRLLFCPWITVHILLAGGGGNQGLPWNVGLPSRSKVPQAIKQGKSPQ